MNALTNKVLVLGIDDRSTLTIIRSLGRRGLIVHLGFDHDDTICRDSKYVTKLHKMPSAGSEPKAWVHALITILANETFDLVIPTSDNYLVLVVRNRSKLDKFSKLAIPCDKGFEFSYKKDKTFELAESLNIPIPKTFPIRNLDDFHNLKTELKFPIVIKPTSSKVWKNDTRHSLKVGTALDKDELLNKLKKDLPLCPVLLQTFHPGIGVGIEMLLQDGNLIAAFQHERVHEPLKGGGSSYRKSAGLDKNLLDYSKRLMRALNWTGVCMIEFKYDKKNNEVVLMEINGRFWGSLPLAYNSGANFPSWLYDVLVLNRRPEIGTYKVDFYCRNLTRDFDWFRENLFSKKNDPLKISVPIPTVLMELRNILLFRERFDELALDDMKPGIIQLFRYFINKSYSLVKLLIQKFHRVNYEYNIIFLFFRNYRLKQILKHARSILFICKGNICRSPYAEYYLNKKLREQSIYGLTVSSTGFINKYGRKSPIIATEVASSFGVNLLSHRSTVIEKDLVEQHDIIYVMDGDLYHHFQTHFPGYHHKLFYLGQLGDDFPRKIIIKDPYGHNYKIYQSVYKQISNRIDYMVDLLSESREG